jgi:AcrR family transcriptional regulator
MSLRAVKPLNETQTRILDAAEELFMQHGFEGTSMRQLTAKAAVNLAAVNYHFGSKDALIEAVFRRRLDPMNAERLAELDRLELEAAGKPLAAEALIDAFIGVSLAMIEDGRGGGRNFVRLLGRTYTDPSKTIRTLLGQMYAQTMERFRAAFARSLPEVPREELNWRLHFMFGTLSYTLAATDAMNLIAGAKPEDRYDARQLRARLIDFLAAGLLARDAASASVKKAA